VTTHKYQKFITRTEQAEHSWEIASVEGALRIRPVREKNATADSESQAEWTSLGGGRYLIRVDGRPIVARVVRTSADEYWVESQGRQLAVRSEDEISARAARQQRAAQAGRTGPIAVPAPMPGTVVQLLVADGDTVAEGQPLLIIEAMKMQNELASPAAGTVHGLAVEPGQAVDARQKLCEVIR